MATTHSEKLLDITEQVVAWAIDNIPDSLRELREALFSGGFLDYKTIASAKREIDSIIGDVNQELDIRNSEPESDIFVIAGHIQNLVTNLEFNVKLVEEGFGEDDDELTEGENADAFFELVNSTSERIYNGAYGNGFGASGNMNIFGLYESLDDSLEKAYVEKQ